MPKGPIDGDQVYEAERLLDKRIQNGQVQYFIKWKGWPNKFNTWEPEENILDKTLVTMYEHYQSLDMGPSSANRTKRKTTPDTSPIKLRKRSVEDLDSSSPSKLRRSIRSNKSSKNLNENVDEEEDEYSEKKNKKKKGIQKIQSSPLSLPSGANLEAQNFATTSDNDEEVDKEQDTNESAENVSTADESEKSSDKPKKKMSPREINELKNQPKPNNIQLETSTEELTETSAEDEIITEVTTNDILSENDDNDLITAPVEIYVEKKIEEVTSTDGSTKKDIYIITNADDPNCTHKIQVHSIPRKKNNTSSETINDEEENTECTESAKSNDFLETKLWYNNNNASSSEINLNSEPYQYNGSPIITDVTVNNETVTIIEF